jgi:hypothetical protein
MAGILTGKPAAGQPMDVVCCAYFARLGVCEAGHEPSLDWIFGKFGFARLASLTILPREISA